MKNKVYPITIQTKKDDEMYGYLKSSVLFLCFCVSLCVGIIVLMVVLIEKEHQENVNNTSYLNI